jgi:hypothetical protein
MKVLAFQINFALIMLVYPLHAFKEETSIALKVRYTSLLTKEAQACNEDPNYIMRDCLDSWVSPYTLF